MATKVGSGEQLIDIHFPKAGVDLTLGFNQQPARAVVGGEYARTSVLGVNVRGYESITARNRGGSRAGISNYINSPLVAGWMVQEINSMAISQLSQSGRVVYLLAVSQGNVYYSQPGSALWNKAANGTGNATPLNFTGIVFSSANNQKMYYADGVNFVYFDPTDFTVHPWVASDGTLPVDSAGNAPRLITTWRGRTVVSGLLLDPQNWFMSAVSDPTNWDYSPLSQTPTQAVAGNNSPLGLIGDVVTGMVPYTDDVLIFFGDHTIYLMQGDPAAGGNIDLVSDIIGAPFGMAWCKDPYGTVYFVSNRMGIYTLVPGSVPQRISQPIEQLLANVNTGTNSIRLIWNDRFQGVHFFITSLIAPAVTTHFFYEVRSGAWWTDQFGSTNYDPMCCCVYDGNLPTDRVALIGSWDGYVRALDPTATTDDGTPISSSVLIGPLLTKDFDDMMLKDLQIILAAASGSVQFDIYIGPTAELAVSSNSVLSGTWSATTLNGGRNFTSLIRRAGHAVYVKLSSTNQWAMEAIRARVETQGKVRQRGK